MRVLITLILFVACGTKQEINVIQKNRPTVVYKTNGDYIHLVPVLLNTDKTAIVSYPHPSDLKVNGKFTYPEKLVGGYLMDKRGINVNVAFLKFTYEEYAAFKEVPDLTVLFESIVNANPIKEIYACGQMNKTQLIHLIKTNKLKTHCQ